MTIPFELPFGAGEVPAIAEILFQFAGEKTINDDTRQRVATRAAALDLKTITPYCGSLQKDPTHQSAWFLAVDGTSHGVTRQLLLRIALASSPASALFPNSVLIGRMRTTSNREIVANTVPFTAANTEALRAFAEKVDRVFLPRPQGGQSAIAVGNRHPEISLPAAFDAFRAIHKRTGLNVASIAACDGEAYHAGLWAAIRSGWREGYNAEAGHFLVTGNTSTEIAHSIAAAKEAIRQAADYTKFSTDTSHLFDPRADTRHREPYSDTEVEDRFAQILTPDDAGWVLEEFGTHSFTPLEIKRLAVKFCRSLLLNEDLYDHINRVKLQSASRSFDFEPSLDEADTLTTPKELLFYLHWLRARGRPAQLVQPNLGFEGTPLEELRARVSGLAAAARYCNATLSIHGSGKQPEVLEAIGRATGGRWNYKISSELQLQLFEAPDGDQRFLNEKLNELPQDLVTEVRRRNTEYIIWVADHLRG
ncbi:MAG: hypothetical protein HY820_07175 [Acidobacteria bacterium]|nr:hypothetical protein [Acidobacteriota bacterium]